MYFSCIDAPTFLKLSKLGVRRNTCQIYTRVAASVVQFVTPPKVNPSELLFVTADIANLGQEQLLAFLCTLKPIK